MDEVGVGVGVEAGKAVALPGMSFMLQMGHFPPCSYSTFPCSGMGHTKVESASAACSGAGLGAIAACASAAEGGGGTLGLSIF